MRKLIVSVISTLDAYAGEGDVFVMPIDLGFDRYNLERMQAADTILLGANSFHMARATTGLRSPTTPPPRRSSARSRGSTTRSPRSSSPTAPGPEDTAPWDANTEIVRRAEAHARVADLKAGQGGDIICFGSLTTWNDLLAHSLVDELHILVGPGVIGSGVPTFSQRVEQEISLLDMRRLEDVWRTRRWSLCGTPSTEQVAIGDSSAGPGWRPAIASVVDPLTGQTAI